MRRVRWGAWFLWIIGLGLAASACSTDDDHSESRGGAGSPAAASANIGQSGGTLTSLDGKVRLTIPPGALANTETIIIRSINPAAFPPEFAGAEIAWDLEPDGLPLSEPAQLSVTLPQVPRQAGGRLRVPLSVLRTLAGATPEAPGNPALTVDGNTAAVSGTVTQLSPFALFSNLRGASLPNGGSISVELNPLPEKLTVGQPYQADLQISVTGLEEADPAAGKLFYRDQSQEPLRHASLGLLDPDGFTELPVPSPLPTSGSVGLGDYGSYVCEAEADTARFSLELDASIFTDSETVYSGMRLSFNTTHTCKALPPPPTGEKTLFLSPLFQPEALFELPSSVPEPFFALFGLEGNRPYAAVGYNSGMSIIDLHADRLLHTNDLRQEAPGLQGAVAHLYHGKGCLFGYGEHRYRSCYDPAAQGFGPTEISTDGPYHDAGLISETPTPTPSGVRQLLWFVEADKVHQENQPGGPGSLVFERKLERGWFAIGGAPTGTSKSAYFANKGAPVLVVRGGPSEPGQLWWGNPAEQAGGRFVGTLGNDTRKIRCEIPICAVSNFAGLVTLVFWDGITPPRILDTIPETTNAVGIDVRAEGGGRDILSTDFTRNTWTLTRVSLSGQILSSSTSPVPESCTNPGHGRFVIDPQTRQVHIVLSCNGVNAEGMSALIQIPLP